jgi:nicotinamidase-related amidase
VAHFRVRGISPEQAFTFTLADIHTDPDESDTELDALADVFVAVRQAGTEDDVILLGDLNVDEYHFGRLGQLPDIAYLRERGLTRLFVVGLATDFCVAYSALDARRLGFEVTVIEAGCRGIDVGGSLAAVCK